MQGATGLAVRYHDQVLAFVTSHFASDSKGKKRVNKRNEVGSRRFLSFFYTSLSLKNHKSRHSQAYLCVQQSFVNRGYSFCLPFIYTL